MNITGLERLTKDWIENKAQEALERWCPEVLDQPRPFPIEKICDQIRAKGYRVELTADLLPTPNGKKVLGCLSLEDPYCIYIDKSLEHDVRKPFVFAHELGHFVLHRKVTFDKGEYDTFIDTDDRIEGLQGEMNDRFWLEWQANTFAAALLMPKATFSAVLCAVQKAMGISRTGYIYVTKERYSQRDYHQTLEGMASLYGVSKTNILYRLQSFDLIQDESRPKPLSKLVANNIF